MLQGKKILLGVTGGIAAYKAVEAVSRLRKAGAEVRVVMTKEATEFVTELTFREISGKPVTVDMWAPVQHWNVAHIALADWADLVLVAPATANILAKAALGVADDMLTTTMLAVTAPIFFRARDEQQYVRPSGGEGKYRKAGGPRRAFHRSGDGKAGLRRGRAGTAG